MRDLKPHPDQQIKCHTIGSERQPVLVIDNLLNDPQPLIDEASHCSFSDDTGLFPGHRAPAPDAYTQALESVLPPLVAQYFGTRPGDIRQVESSYSLVTQPPHTLKPLQRIPHFDSQHSTELATIFFLCNRKGAHYGGTAFYRHRSSGYEWIDHTRFPTYIRDLEAHAYTHGPPAADYIRGSTDAFEQIAHFPAIYNRLLVYRCTSLHSGMIEEDFNFDRNPRTARLSINSFLVG